MKYVILIGLLVGLSACYTFRGVTIPPEVLTFSVENVENRADAVVPGLAQDFTQSLRDRIRNESRLEEASTNQVADIEFSGFVSRWETNSLAPKPGEQTALSQLKIYIKVAAQYREEKFIENEFNQTFSFQVEYPAEQNLLDIQDQLIEQIFDQITNDVFNKAFTSW